MRDVEEGTGLLFTKARCAEGNERGRKGAGMLCYRGDDDL